MYKAKMLRKLLHKRDLLIVPGVYDALTAKIARYCGFFAVYMTGYGTAASYGYPDYGLLTMTEMVENVRRIHDAVDIPLIADADTGYGNPINVYRTVREYEKAGAAAIQIEDQTWPKISGNTEDKRVIDSAEMVAKIKAAVNAKIHSETVLVIRTDAIATHGFEEALRRAEMYAEAGADALFIEAPATEEQIRKIPLCLPKPCLINMSHVKQALDIKALKEMGYSIAIFPTITLFGAIEGSLKMCKSLFDEGKLPELTDMRFNFKQLSQFLGFDKFKEFESKLTVK